MFLLAGPSVPHDPASIAPSYFDVLPTLLRLKGFEKPAALQGRSVLPAHDAIRDEDCVECDQFHPRMKVSHAK